MSRAISTIGWGVFCACSWTWCIGLYLPSIMLDRYGWAGFIAFAIPNVIGCSLFGYLLDRRRSAAMIERTGTGMAWFSVATLAYHLFFVVYVVDRYAPATALGGLTPPLVALAVYLIGLLIARVPDRLWPGMAALLYVGSVTAFVIVVRESPGIDVPMLIDPVALAWLVPSLLLGFLLCPYLDLTFHRALQRSPSRHAFGVFGVTFAVMILFSCFIWRPERPLLIVAWAHLAGQCVFTVAAHAREIAGGARQVRIATPVAIGLPLLAIPVLAVARMLPEAVGTGNDMYLRFLGLYGWIFPVFVLLFIGPGGRWPIDRRTLLLYAAVAIVFLPCLELGILQRVDWLAAIPVVAVVACKTIIALRHRRTA